MLSATSPPHHLRVFSTLLCFFSSSSNSLLSCYPLISPYMPPISELAALVSFCPPHVTQPLSCVVCLNSTILPLSALVTLTIFRTQFFPHTCSLCCSSSVRCPLVFLRSASPSCLTESAHLVLGRPLGLFQPWMVGLKSKTLRTGREDGMRWR